MAESRSLGNLGTAIANTGTADCGMYQAILAASCSPDSLKRHIVKQDPISSLALPETFAKDFPHRGARSTYWQRAWRRICSVNLLRSLRRRM
jgi:hypothetical protein